MRKLFLILSAILPFKWLRSRSGTNPLIVNYHVVSDHTLGHINNLYQFRSIKSFNKDIDFYQAHYTPISIHQFLEYINGKFKLPKNSILLTFDDGLTETYDVAKTLIEKKFPATFFLTKTFIDNKELSWDHKKSLIINKINSEANSEQLKLIASELETKADSKKELSSLVLNLPYRKKKYLDRIGAILKIDFDTFLVTHRPYLTSSEIKELIDGGISIGGHSIDHPPYKELNIDEQIEQTIESVDFVDQKFSLGYRVFAFPYSDLSVSRGFFKKIDKTLDVSFGTNGVLSDSALKNFQRVSIESFTHSAKKTIKFHYLRNFVYKLAGKKSMKRVN